MQKTISMSKLAGNVDRVFQDIEAGGAVYRITKRGKPSMLLMDEQYFDSWKATIEIMQRHPNWREELIQGRQELDDRRCQDLATVVRELGLDGLPPTKRTKPARRAPVRRRTKSR